MTAASALCRVEIEVTLGVVSPFLFRGLPGKLLGLDATALRDAQGRAIIPADQIRGVLRDAFEDLSAAGAGITVDQIDALFGVASAAKDDSDSLGDNLPLRTNLIVSDFVDDAPRPRGLETTRIEIDDVTGAVETAKMQVLELVAPMGDEVTFKGQIIAFLPAKDAGGFKEMLRKALLLVRRMGMAKSSGFGRIGGLGVTQRANAPIVVKPATKPAPSAGLRRYRLTFDRPLLVDARWVADNAMQGSDIIPGAVLKGALARRLELAGEKPADPASRLGQALEKLVIGHAFPANYDEKQGFRDTPSRPDLPMSLVAEKTAVADALTLPRQAGYQFDAGNGKKLTPKFQTDWKAAEWEAAPAKLGWHKVEIPVLARTHTAISHEGVAAEAKVFSTLARSHICNIGGTWTPRPWIVDIDTTGASLAFGKETAQLLALLEAGLEGIGKTQATASFTPLSDTPAVVNVFQPDASRHALVLRTPAYLIDGAGLSEKDWDKGPHAHYQAYFDRHFSGARLVDFFAAQSLYGRYLARRYRINGAYYPFLLTNPGSVFLIEVDAAGRKDVENAARCGLPAATVKGDTPTWRNCPFMPENGFGHIWADYQAWSDPDVKLIGTGRVI